MFLGIFFYYLIYNLILILLVRSHKYYFYCTYAYPIIYYY